jgi:hypothetical protein
MINSENPSVKVRGYVLVPNPILALASFEFWVGDHDVADVSIYMKDIFTPPDIICHIPYAHNLVRVDAVILEENTCGIHHGLETWVILDK